MSVLSVQSVGGREIAPTAALRACGLVKRIGERTVLDHVDLAVPPGCYLVLLGANGAGKSTLLNVLSTLVPFHGGQLLLFGQPVTRGNPALRCRLGMIGHQPMLYRDLSARENLVFFGRLYGVADPAERAEALLAEVALADRADDPAGSFSRGMVQRLAIARALVHDPDLLFADEPFAGLDLPSTRRVEQLLARLHADGKTIILANHDVDQSLRLGQRVVVLRRGRVVADGQTAQMDAAGISEEVLAP